MCLFLYFYYHKILYFVPYILKIFCLCFVHDIILITLQKKNILYRLNFINQSVCLKIFDLYIFLLLLRWCENISRDCAVENNINFILSINRCLLWPMAQYYICYIPMKLLEITPKDLLTSWTKRCIKLNKWKSLLVNFINKHNYYL